MAVVLSESTLPPWWQETWRRLQERRRAGTLPHALLIAGAEGMGKSAFAGALTAALLCLEPGDDGHACGHCSACRLREAGTHPDLLQVVPEEEGKAIGIGQVRAQNAFLALTRQFDRHKISLIAPADSMTTAAANALLKTLEEPAAGTLLLLVSARPAALPATVRSRCQRIDAQPPAPAVALRWLREVQPELGESAELLLTLAEGAPYRALTMAAAGSLDARAQLLADLEALVRGRAEPVSVAANWLKKRSVNEALYWLSRFVTDMIRLGLAGGSGNPLNRDRVEILQRWAQRSRPSSLYTYLDRVEEARRLLAAQVKLNDQLLLEGLLAGWATLSEERPATVA